MLEAAVAFVIATLALAVVMQSAGDSARTTRHALDSADAVERARSRMAAIDHGGLMAGEKSGDDGGGYRWRTVVTPLQTTTDVRSEPSLPRNSPLLRHTLYTVRVEIAWTGPDGARTFSLRSERLGPAAPGAGVP